MTKRTVILVILVFAVLVSGMVYYTWLVSQEQQESVEPTRATELREPLPAGVEFTTDFRLPLRGSAPTTALRHSIPLNEIRRGCVRQDCIPSVDDPNFVPATQLATTLPTSSLGIVLAGAERFYPFPMLETREIVNDVMPDGTPVAITYCPLCGTGIVFDRTLEDGTVAEFGVSGMLWQSNLLMYNRASELRDRSLWSQVLGEAVVGDRAGEQLVVVPSDVITYGDWLQQNPAGATLDTGGPQDPYNGNYYDVASRFQPNFNATQSPLPPMTRVHGIVVNDQAKAYVSRALQDGLTDIISGERIFIERSSSSIRFLVSNAETGQPPTQLPDIEGFWFSWAAAYPETELWTGTSTDSL